MNQKSNTWMKTTNNKNTWMKTKNNTNNNRIFTPKTFIIPMIAILVVIAVYFVIKKKETEDLE